MQWRPSRGVSSPIYGYEVPYKPSRHFFSPELIAQPTLKCNAIPTKELPWRAHRKTFPNQTGALSGGEDIRHRKYVPPMVVDEKPTVKAWRGGSDCGSKESEWKSGRHVSGKSGCETTQQDFHPHRRHIPKGGSSSLIRHPKKAPGVYKRDDGEWVPPFRAPTPEMVAPAGVPLRHTGKKAAPDFVRRDEWQPAFRSCSTPDSPGSVTPPDSYQRPTSRGLKHCQSRPDEWCPPWKQQHFHPQHLQTSIDDASLQRNATIDEDANCTHYLDDEGLGMQQEHHNMAGAEEVGEDGEADISEEKDEAATENEPLSVDDYYASACDACDEQQSNGGGRVIGGFNTCWNAAADD
jgi:hypothetical protein